MVCTDLIKSLLFKPNLNVWITKHGPKNTIDTQSIIVQYFSRALIFLSMRICIYILEWVQLLENVAIIGNLYCWWNLHMNEMNTSIPQFYSLNYMSSRLYCCSNVLTTRPPLLLPATNNLLTQKYSNYMHEIAHFLPHLII